MNKHGQCCVIMAIQGFGTHALTYVHWQLKLCFTATS